MFSSQRHRRRPQHSSHKPSSRTGQHKLPTRAQQVRRRTKQSRHLSSVPSILYRPRPQAHIPQRSQRPKHTTRTRQHRRANQPLRAKPRPILSSSPVPTARAQRPNRLKKVLTVHRTKLPLAQAQRRPHLHKAVPNEQATVNRP